MRAGGRDLLSSTRRGTARATHFFPCRDCSGVVCKLVLQFQLPHQSHRRSQHCCSRAAQVCWQLHGSCQSTVVTPVRSCALPVPQVSRGATSLALHDHAQATGAPRCRLDAVRCSHCTECLLFVRATDYCSSTASIDGSIDLERICPRKRAGAEQGASAIGGLSTVVAASITRSKRMLAMRQDRAVRRCCR